MAALYPQDGLREAPVSLEAKWVPDNAEEAPKNDQHPRLKGERESWAMRLCGFGFGLSLCPVFQLTCQPNDTHSNRRFAP